MSGYPTTVGLPARPIQVLSLGASGLFVTDLYREMRTRWPGLRFDVCDFQSFGSDCLEAPVEAFESSIRSHRMGLDLPTLNGLIRAMMQRQFYRRMGDAACFRRWPLSRDVVALSVRNARLRADRLAPTGYALCHLHSCTTNTMAYVDAIPPTTRLVCSFWGSDLLRSSGPEAILQIHRGLRQADVITTQSPELREIILSTYGRELAPRVHCCRFPANPSLFGEIETFTQSIDVPPVDRRWIVRSKRSHNPSTVDRRHVGISIFLRMHKSSS